MQVDGALTVTESGSLTGGDWNAQVSLVADAECSATLAGVRPRAELVIALVQWAGTTIDYQTPPTCKSRASGSSPPIKDAKEYQRLQSALASVLATEDGMSPTTVGLVVATAVGWGLALALGAALVCKIRKVGRTPPSSSTVVSTGKMSATAS